MTNAPIWKSRPVFITSTFQDMQAERDHLRKFVFPAPEEWLLTKRRHLEWIDLRVGVASASAENEEARELMVLKVCLDEVKRSRPFLIALIGDRYGWVPPKERIAAAAKEVGFSAEVEDRSATDLEIDFGVFHDVEQRRRSLFFLRRPLPYEKMGVKAADYSVEYDGSDKDADLHRERLEALKTRIRTEFSDRCFEYSADWDEKEVHLTGLVANWKTDSVLSEEEKAKDRTGFTAWGLAVQEKIKQAIEDELAAEPAAETELTADDVERGALADFAEDRARDFIGRKDILGEIEALFGSPAGENAPWGLCITGEAGSGKSALFGALYQGLTRAEKDEPERLSDEQRALYARLRKLDALVLAHAAGASPRASSVDAMLRRWIGELAAFLKEDPGLSDKASPNDVEAKFSSLLGRAALKRRVIVLADALDQFEQTTQGRFATWLPRLWPANARFIGTAIPGEASAELEKRPGVTLMPIPALDANEARHIAAAISARYHRKLEPQVLDALISGDKRWSNPLWLVLAVEELNLLDADDFARAKLLSGRDDERIRALMCQMATEFPADIPGLYRKTFDRAAELFGTKLTQAFLGLIAVSRSGWRESDFRELLPKVTGEKWDELYFAQLRRSFRGQMRRRGGMDRWDFAHAQMRIAAKEWLIETKAPAEVPLHTTIGDYLLSLPADDPLHVSETMLHLMEGDWTWRPPQHYYGASLTDSELQGATWILADIILTAPKEDATAGARRVARLLETADLRDSTVSSVANRVTFDLDEAIRDRTALQVRDVLVRAAESALTRLSDREPSNAGWQCDLSVSNDGIGDVLVAQGNLPEALKAFRDGLAIRERLARSDPGNAGWQRNLSISYDRIGDVLMARGNLPEALKAISDSLAIRERLAQSDPRNAGSQNDLAGSWVKIGEVLVALGKLPDALRAFRDGLAIMKYLTQVDPGNADWQRVLLASWIKIGEVLVAQGNLSEALRAFRDSHAIAERLAWGDPSNTDWQHDLSGSWFKIGDVLVAQGNLSEALRAFRDSLAIRERLAQGDPGNAGWQRDLSASWIKIGEVLKARGNLPEALQAFRDSHMIFEHLARIDPGNVNWQRDRSVSSMKIGDVLVAQGNLPEALKVFRIASPSENAWHGTILVKRTGSAISRSRTIELATCWWRKTICPRH